MSATLHDSAATYIAEVLPHDAGKAQAMRSQRAYMAGAMEVLSRIGRGEQRGDLLRQVLDYGRTVGTALEAAR